MGEVYVWSEMDAGNWEAPRGKGKLDIETGWAQKVVERYAPTYLSPPPLKESPTPPFMNVLLCDVKSHNPICP